MSVSGGSKPPPYGWASGPAVKLAYGATLIIRLGTKSVILNEVKDLNLPMTRFFALLRMTDQKQIASLRSQRRNMEASLRDPLPANQVRAKQLCLAKGRGSLHLILCPYH